MLLSHLRREVGPRGKWDYLKLLVVDSGTEPVSRVQGWTPQMERCGGY